MSSRGEDEGKAALPASAWDPFQEQLKRFDVIDRLAAEIGISPSCLTTMRDLFPELHLPEPGEPDVYGETVALADHVDRESEEGRRWRNYL